MKSRFYLHLLPAVLCAWLALAAHARGSEKYPADGEYIVYIGTCTATTSKGIRAYRFQPSSGKLTPIGMGSCCVTRGHA